MVYSRDPGTGRDPDNLLQQPERPRFTAAEAPLAASNEAPATETPPEPAFRSGPAATPLDKCTNVIAPEARWKGSLSIPDSVRIEGQFSGDIDAKGTVHIASGASVDAKIRATYVIIGGNFRGEIRCTERTELLAKAKVLGDVFTRLFTIHEGAVIDGSIHMSTDKPAENGRGSSSASRNGESTNGSRGARTEAAAFNE